MRVVFTVAFAAFALALCAVAVLAETEDAESTAQTCGLQCVSPYPWCHVCLDGSKACLSSAFGVCCGCVNGNCWSCDHSSQCHITEPGRCYYPASVDGGGIAGIVVGCIVFVGIVILVVVCCCRHRHRWSSGGYSEVVVSPAPAIVPVPVGVSYGYGGGHHHHHHSGGAVGVGYQVGGGSSAVGVGYQVGGNASGVGYQVH